LRRKSLGLRSIDSQRTHTYVLHRRITRTTLQWCITIISISYIRMTYMYVCIHICMYTVKKSFAKFRCGQRWREPNEVGVGKFLLPRRLVLRQRCQHRSLAHSDMAFFTVYICTIYRRTFPYSRDRGDCLTKKAWPEAELL
jgi:hypothetical protein